MFRVIQVHFIFVTNSNVEVLRMPEFNHLTYHEASSCLILGNKDLFILALDKFSLFMVILLI